MPSAASTAENAKLEYEAGQTPYAMEALTDSGDQTHFTSNAALCWSNKNGCAPDVRPDGVITGLIATPDNAGVDNVIDISAGTCYLAGVETSVTAGELTASRGAGAAPCRITSLTVTSAGALAAVAGTAGAALSATRGAAGGPPYIPVDDIEIAQVKLTAEAAAPIESGEIYMVPNVHRELYDFPLWDENSLPTTDNGIDGGTITFHAALMAAHTADVPKGVYAEYYEPTFAELPNIVDFVPPDTSHSVSSKQVYNNTIAGRSSSLNQGSFTAYCRSGISDAVARLRNEILTFRYYPDRYKSPYILCQGKLGISRSYPPGDNISAACTISAVTPAVNMNA